MIPYLLIHPLYQWMRTDRPASTRIFCFQEISFTSQASASDPLLSWAISLRACAPHLLWWASHSWPFEFRLQRFFPIPEPCWVYPGVLWVGYFSSCFHLKIEPGLFHTVYFPLTHVRRDYMVEYLALRLLHLSFMSTDTPHFPRNSQMTTRYFADVKGAWLAGSAIMHFTVPDHLCSQSTSILKSYPTVEFALKCFSVWVTFLTPWVYWSLCIPRHPRWLGEYATILGTFGLNPIPAKNLLVALAWAEPMTFLGMHEDDSHTARLAFKH